MRSSGRHGFIAAGVLLVASVLGAERADAGTGIRYWRWADSGMTLSSSSYQYSNATGFWQAIVNANGCSLTLDGVFGNYTTWWTAHFQNQILGTNNGGIVNSWTWNGTQDAQWWDPIEARWVDRLDFGSVIDGWGTQHWWYYAGGGSSALLGWNPFSSQWLFAPYPNSYPFNGQFLLATPNRTMGSYPACAA